MSKDWMRGQGYVKAPKIEKELGVGKDGYQQGGIKVEVTKKDKSQKVTVKGTGKAKKQTATWY